MAIRAAINVAFFLMDGLSLLAHASDLSDGQENIFDDIKPLGEAWPQPTPTGDKMAEFTQNGWFETAAGATHAAFNELQGTSRVLAYGYSGNTIGQPFTGYAGIYAGKYKRLAQRNMLHKANAEYAISGAVDEGVILHALGAETADGNTQASSVDRNDETTVPTAVIVSSSVANPTVVTTATPHGLASTQKAMIAGHTSVTPDINGERVATVVSTTTLTVPVNVSDGGVGGTIKALTSLNGGFAHLQITALTLGGHTDFAASVQHSEDDAIFVELVAFTAATALGAQRVSVAGTIYRYLASTWDFTGAGSGPSATFMIGFARA